LWWKSSPMNQSAGDPCGGAKKLMELVLKTSA
jgi:hypothetical protein